MSRYSVSLPPVIVMRPLSEVNSACSRDRSAVSELEPPELSDPSVPPKSTSGRSPA